MVSTSLNPLHKKYFPRIEFSSVQIVDRLVQDSGNQVLLGRVKV